MGLIEKGFRPPLKYSLRIGRGKKLEGYSHQAGPAGLVAIAQAGPVVAVEIFVEQKVITLMGEGLSSPPGSESQGQEDQHEGLGAEEIQQPLDQPQFPFEQRKNGCHFGGKLARIPSTTFFSSPEAASVRRLPVAVPRQTGSLLSAREMFRVSIRSS